MKMNLIFLFLVTLASCDPAPPLFHPEEEAMMGRWQEIAPKAPYYDTNGVLIDSIDVSASYEFKDDFTYTSINDIWTEADSGTWAFDSTYTELILYPSYGDSSNVYRKDTWSVTHKPPMMHVGHTYDLDLPDQTITVYLQRDFIKIE